MRRFLSTSKRWPRSGWNGWRISAHPKCELWSSAVRSDRPDGPGPGDPNGGEVGDRADLRGGFSTVQLLR
jgi:hypothetical protein